LLLGKVQPHDAVSQRHDHGCMRRPDSEFARLGHEHEVIYLALE
jgi:hypothetical protein